jgi:hypothetical protein
MTEDQRNRLVPLFAPLERDTLMYLLEETYELLPEPVIDELIEALEHAQAQAGAITSKMIAEFFGDSPRES